MKVLIDETGNFELRNFSDVSAIILVTIPTTDEEPLLKLLDSIETAYTNPIKGTNIEFTDRLKVFEYLGNNPTIKYSMIVTSWYNHSDISLPKFKQLQLEKLDKSIDIPRKKGNASLSRDLELLRNQINKLSDRDFAEFISITGLLIEWLKVFLFDYINYPAEKDNWSIEWLIDTLRKPEKMKRLIRNFIALTTNSLNPEYGVFLPAEWPQDHPFLLKYDTKDGLNGRELFKNLGFYSEQEKPLLKIPDLIGNTVVKALRQPDNIAYIEIVKKLKQNRSLYMTLKNKKSYFIVTGFDKSMTRAHPNMQSLHRNLNR